MNSSTIGHFQGGEFPRSSICKILFARYNPRPFSSTVTASPPPTPGRWGHDCRLRPANAENYWLPTDPVSVEAMTESYQRASNHCFHRHGVGGERENHERRLLAASRLSTDAGSVEKKTVTVEVVQKPLIHRRKTGGVWSLVLLKQHCQSMQNDAKSNGSIAGPKVPLKKGTVPLRPSVFRRAGRLVAKGLSPFSTGC